MGREEPGGFHDDQWHMTRATLTEKYQVSRLGAHVTFHISERSRITTACDHVDGLVAADRS
jgi:hypothetical protein